jgi:cytochrome c biogenesis protein
MKGPKGRKPEPQKQGSVFSDIASFFTSVRTTITLLFVLAAASILGTVIPQTSTPDQITGVSSPIYYRLLVILDLYNVYRSWWFILILVLLSLNLLGCILKRLPAIAAEWKGHSAKSSFKFSIADPRAPSQIKNVISTALKPVLGGSPETLEDKDGLTLRWTKHRVYLLGFPFLHTAIIIILLGGLVGLVYGTRGHVVIVEGESADKFQLPNGETRVLPFQIAVDKFTLTQYPTGEPKEFRSDVRLLEGGKQALEGSIRVNHPLTYKGISLYQSDYQVTGVKDVKFEIMDSGGKSSELVVEPRTTKQIAGSNLEIRLLKLDPGATKRGARVEVAVTGSGQENRVVSLHRKDTEPMKVGDLQIRFLDYAPLYATGLQIGYDPGAMLVWIGCGFLVLGFSLALFTNYRGVTVRIYRQAKGCGVEVSGTSRRLRREFREDVDERIRGQLLGQAPQNPGKKSEKPILDN